ncbi:MAG: hypothetical protein ACM3SU_02395 [Acidobacteriota bacterium]
MLRDVLNRRVLAAAARQARARGTPFYLFDESQLVRQARAWRRAAEAVAPAEVFYPYKCNRTAPVVDLLSREGFGAEVASSADFDAASGRGLSGERIVIQGPAKETHLIDAGLGAGALLVADGREDARAILLRARALGIEPRYLLRLAPSSAAREQRRFGLAASELLALAREISRRRAPRPEGLAFHLGTGIASAQPYLRALREAGKVSAALARLGIPVRTLDLGGGFAAETESRLDERGQPRAAGRIPSDRLPRLAREARRRIGPGLRLLLEPGRALVSGSFHLVSRVVRVKRSRPRATIYLDASCVSHAFFVAHGRHPTAVIPRRRGTTRSVALAGPLGVGFDLFAPSVALTPVAPGDLVVIGSVGAYNQNAASAWAGPVPGSRRIM